MISMFAQPRVHSLEFVVQASGCRSRTDVRASLCSEIESEVIEVMKTKITFINQLLTRTHS